MHENNQTKRDKGRRDAIPAKPLPTMEAEKVRETAANVNRIPKNIT